MAEVNSSGDLRNKKILLVEDESFLADLLSDYIKEQGGQFRIDLNRRGGSLEGKFSQA